MFLAINFSWEVFPEDLHVEGWTQGADVQGWDLGR